MKESDIQTLIKNSAEAMSIKGVFELKFCNLSKSKSLAWDRVAQHQVESLIRAKHEVLYHKISDSFVFAGGSRRFPSPKPFDYINITCDAYVVVCFYQPKMKGVKQYKNVYFIDIDVYVSEWEYSSKKSYNEIEAEAMSSKKISL